MEAPLSHLLLGVFRQQEERFRELLALLAFARYMLFTRYVKRGENCKSIEVTKYHLISLLSSKYKDDFHDEDVLAADGDLVGVSVAAAIRRPVLRRGGAEHADGAATAHDGGRLQGETGR